MADLPPFNHTNSLRACQHGGARNANKKPMLDDARYRSQQCREARRVGYSSQMGIDEPMAPIGDKNVTVPGLSDHHLAGDAGFGKGPGDGALRRRQPERNDLDW